MDGLYWTVTDSDIVNSGREEQIPICLFISLEDLPPNEVWGLTSPYLQKKRAKLISEYQPSALERRYTSSYLTVRHNLSIRMLS